MILFYNKKIPCFDLLNQNKGNMQCKIFKMEGMLNLFYTISFLKLSFSFDFEHSHGDMIAASIL